MPTPIAEHFLPRAFLPRPSHSEGASTTSTAEVDSPITIPVTEIDEIPPDPIFGLISEMDLGPRLNHRLTNLVKVVGVDAVSSRSGVDRAYNLSEGTALGLRIDDKIYEYDDPYVVESEVRRACTGKLINASGGRAVVWVETAGVLESGSGAQGTLSLGAGGGFSGNLSYGFTAGGLLRFRTSQAFSLGLTQNRKDLVKNQSFQIPRTAAEAKLMPFGSEIEITGQGKLHGEFGLGIGLGPSVAGATAGLALSVDARADVAQEFGVNVMALDGYRKIRVTLKQLNSQSSSLTAMLRAGLIFAPNTLTPPCGAGLLKYLVLGLGYKSIEELVNAYTTLTARISRSDAHQGTCLASYDFDLDNPEAQKAYEQILKLSPGDAEKLTKKTNAGVTKVVAEENETSSRSLVDITLFGEKLYLAETLRLERSGRLLHDDKEVMVYRDSVYKKRWESWFSGRKEVEWESVSVKDSKTKKEKPYFRFHFQKKDYKLDPNQNDGFFNFARSLGIHSAELMEDVPERMSDYNKVLSTAKEIDTEVDIYFTQEGIQHIDKADAKLATDAFLKASSEIIPEHAKLPQIRSDAKSIRATAIMNEYCIVKKNSHWCTCNGSELSQLRDEYWALTGRELKKDKKVVEEAEKFGAAVESLKNASDAKQAATFFTNFGKSQGFDFMRTVSALQKLAGDKHTLIHALSLGGGGIRLKSRDEGAIEHPRETVMNVLMRAA